ncbi:hypothetical protein [Blastococcus litoris]|uniref:hypothetical protein n=1 Tax=Blastococcus litoris TaxID=2171622 RepID=UPI000E30ACFB|nr:hypothetical protein [Blastococcus litoris]
MDQRDALAALLPPLVPVAVLLTDSPDEAVALLAAALATPGALDDPDSARRALVRTGPRAPGRVVQVVESATTPPDDEDGALASALRALPGRDRAMAVLHLVADPLPAGEGDRAVALLRADLVGRDDDDRRARDLAAAPFRPPGTTQSPGGPRPELRERLSRLAAGRALPPTALDTITTAVRDAARSRRRRRRAAAAAVVTAVLLLALTPLLPRGPGAPPAVFGGPTIGSLAGDDGFLQGMREASWPGAPPDRGVVFAGDVPAGRWALVAAGGTPSRPAAVAWFTGPAGGAADRMVLRSVRTAPDPALPVSASDPATGALVVVGAPGDRVEVSERPVVTADGAVTRDHRRVPSPEGLAVVGLPPLPGTGIGAVRVRVVRDGRPLPLLPPTVLADPGEPDLDVRLTRLRPAPAPAVQEVAVGSRLRSVLGQLGLPADDTPVTELWSGDLPGPEGSPTRLSVLAVAQPSGAFVVTAPYGYEADPGGPAVTSWCGTGVLPAGPPPGERVVVLRCDFRDLSMRAEISRFLVVVAPRTATSVQVLDGSGAAIGEHPLADGVVVVRSPGDVGRVAVTTADGGTVEAVPFVNADLAG